MPEFQPPDGAKVIPGEGLSRKIAFNVSEKTLKEFETLGKMLQPPVSASVAARWLLERDNVREVMMTIIAAGGTDALQTIEHRAERNAQYTQ